MGEAERFLVKMINATTISMGSEAYFLSDFWNEIAQDERLTTVTMKIFVSRYGTHPSSLKRKQLLTNCVLFLFATAG